MLSIEMNPLLFFIAGIVIGLLLSGYDDNFLHSLKSWLNKTTKSGEKKRADLEYDIEKALPDFRKWIKEKAEKRRKLKRNILLCCLLLVAAVILFEFIQLRPDKGKQPASTFQFNKRSTPGP